MIPHVLMTMKQLCPQMRKINLPIVDVQHGR
jgi:hypothetical protein